MTKSMCPKVLGGPEGQGEREEDRAGWASQVTGKYASPLLPRAGGT